MLYFDINKNEKKMKTEPNLPAFPYEGSGHPDSVGLTKREHFAGLAMQGMISDPNRGYVSKESTAQECVEYADALINALNKEA